MPLTKTEVEQMEPNSTMWDSGRGSIPGFGVRRQSKHPSFCIKYSAKGRQRWFTIGRLGSPWTVETARIEAKRLLGLVASGQDPAVVRDQSPTMTVSDLCDRYMVAAEAGAILTRFNRPKKASTLAIDKGRISRHIKPLIGKKAVDEIDSRAVKRLISDVTTGKTATVVKTKLRGRANVRGGPATAARVADLLSGIMTWAVDEGVIEHNPVHKVRRYRSEARQRFLSNEELGRLGATLAAGKDKDGKVFNPHAVKIVTLLCLTGCRVGEITGLRWGEIDLALKCLRLEDTKTGKSIRPVGDAAVSILNAQRRLAGSPFVFTGSRRKVPYQGIGKEAGRILKAADIEDATPHTLRHTFASAASGLGYSDGTIAGLLGHKGRGVTSRYIHRPDQALASAAQAVSTEISKLLFPQTT
ncbi:tyrosine-type recombinase/integrase [Mesorhizobium sp. BR1-1-4]|uniref:tyrosine-type recombinase/integrase n=1 Tax=Mesorhizobium sp. BR1-1-4 TaxID=2876650 RepID=UPI001CD021C5|nr:site-specific integrase [Mesorhizobium sp. BR1-1-4]MBZ9925033.1 site-specific integrase [Mesorhizobium sp. BR1-1-4]